MIFKTISNSLLMSERQRSGYEYRIRGSMDGSVLLIAEGPVTGGLPRRNQRFDSERLALMAAERWENESERAVARPTGVAPIISFSTS